MDLKTKSKTQLKEIAKTIELVNYEELSKNDLLSLIEDKFKTEPELSALFEEVIVTSAPLIAPQLISVTPQISPVIETIKTQYSPIIIKKWKDYLNRYKLTAEEFLIRYPNHPDTKIIKTLI